MALETTVFTFKISAPFADWAMGFDSTEVVAMHEANTIKTFCRGFNNDDPESVVVIHQAREGITKVFFEPCREAVEATGHIYDSTVICSYLAG